MKIHDKFMKWFMEVGELLRIEALVEAARLVKRAIKECLDKVLGIVMNPLLHFFRQKLEEVKRDMQEVERKSSTFLDIYDPRSNASDPSHSVMPCFLFVSLVPSLTSNRSSQKTTSATS